MLPDSCADRKEGNATRMAAMHSRRLVINHFTLIAIRSYGKYIVATFFHAVAHVIHDSVIENVFFKQMVFMSGCAELYPGEFGYVALEYMSHVIIEFSSDRPDVHRYDGLVELIFTVVYLVCKKLEIRNGPGVVILDGVGVQTDELYPPGNECEVGITENGTVSLFSCTEAVMVADQGHIGYFKLIHDIPLPNEFFGYAEITHVTAMDHEIYVVPLIEVVYKIDSFVIPALGVTHCHEAERCLALAVFFYLLDVVCVDVCLSADVHIVRMVVYQVAAACQ